MTRKAAHADVRAIARRLRMAYVNASDDQHAEGATWYPDARRFIGELQAEWPQYSYAQCAALVAVCSPQCGWERNKRAARIYIAEHAAGIPRARWSFRLAIGRSMERAERVLSGDMTAVSGPKVEAFYANLLGDDQAVTVDTWHARVCLGDGIGLTARRREACIRATRLAARSFGVTPAVLQAVVWLSIRDSLSARAA